MKRPIPAIDLLFLLAETRDSPQHVAGVMLFENPAPDAGWTIPELVARYRAATPVFPFNVVPRMPLGARPHWAEPAGIDMNYHVQHVAVPAPGSDAQLDAMIQRWHDELFDRSQPLFRICVIEGVQDGRFAIYVKFHHAIVDGASAIARILAAVSDDPHAPIGKPLFQVELGAAQAERDERVPPGLLSRLLALSGRTVQGYKVAFDLYLGFWKKTLGRMGGAPASGSLPFEAPMTLFNSRIQHGRAYGRTSLALAPARALAKAAGGTLNDLAMTLVDEAVHRYLAERQQPLDKRLLALVPVSLRAAGDTEATTKISALVIAMGEARAKGVQRLAQVVENMRAGKEELGRMSKSAAGGYSVAIYAIAQLVEKLRVDRPLANMVISNVPGANKPMYLGGSRMTGIFPASVISVGMGLNVTFVSNAGQLDVGITSQRGSIPDPQRIADLMALVLREMLDAAASVASSAPVPTPVAEVAPAAKATRKRARQPTSDIDAPAPAPASAPARRRSASAAGAKPRRPRAKVPA